MSYLPDLRSELVQAARRREHARASAPSGARGGARRRRRAGRWPRAWRWRWAALNVALGLAGTLVGLSAAGVFHRGTALGPEVPPSASSDDGVAVAGSVKLLGLRVPDPAGGLPWGIRIARTTRGLTCVDVGRVDFATIGVLGQDGAFADDGRFHPVADDVFDPLGCDVSDARGDGFVNVALQDAPASGLFAGPAAAGGCSPAEAKGGVLTRFVKGSLRRSRVSARLTPGAHPMPSTRTCPAGDLREIYFGLLGPDARSITYRVPGGGLRTISTSGPQGAYLLVLPQATKGCLAPAPLDGRRDECRYGFRGDRGGPDVPSGVIAAVSYRDGHTCHVPAPGTFASMFGACPPVGFVPVRQAPLSAAQLSTPISVEEVPARAYCAKAQAVEPCDGGVPPGFRSLSGIPPSLLVRVSFTSRVAIPNSASYYEIELHYPQDRGCTTGGTGGPTSSDIRAGQRVTQSSLVPYSCPGVMHGTVSYVPTEGAASSMPITGLPGQGRSVLVGRFSFTVPHARG